MPKYKKKITAQMEYKEFKPAIEALPYIRRAFLSVLFFSGCRVSEALALTSNDISCNYDQDTIYVQFFRLKGSKQTDPTPLPRSESLEWLCAKAYSDTGPIFSFSRSTAYRTVKAAFPEHYPHFFRMNRITKISERFGDSYTYSFMGISASAIDHYRGKVDIKKVGQALKDEIR